MCQFKSGIILKDRVFVPDYDSHSQMLEELGIADTKENAERLFVRVELSPVNGDVFSDISTWKYNSDQDVLPDWYVEEYDKQRMIEAVKKWAENRIHIGKDELNISNGAGHCIKDCRNVIIHGKATVKNICGNVTVKEIHGKATVENIYGNAIVTTSPDAEWINLNKAKIADNAAVRDKLTKTIYQAGDWNFAPVGVSQG